MNLAQAQWELAAAWSELQAAWREVRHEWRDLPGEQFERENWVQWQIIVPAYLKTLVELQAALAGE